MLSSDILLIFTLSLTPRQAVPFLTSRKELKKRKAAPLTCTKGADFGRELTGLRSTFSTLGKTALKLALCSNNQRRLAELIIAVAIINSVPSALFLFLSCAFVPSAARGFKAAK